MVDYYLIMGTRNVNAKRILQKHEKTTANPESVPKDQENPSFKYS